MPSPPNLQQAAERIAREHALGSPEAADAILVVMEAARTIGFSEGWDAARTSVDATADDWEPGDTCPHRSCGGRLELVCPECHHGPGSL